MHFSPIKITALVALLAIGIAHADPVIFIKNNSNRAIHIQPIDQGRQPLMQTQFVKAKGEYKEENVDANDVKGVDIKYCKVGVSCATTDDVRTKGTVIRFEFHDPKATKFYLKLDIDKNDNVSLKQQEGRLGRTSNLKWSLDGNIIQDAISKPRSIGAAPTDMPAPLFSSASKVGISTPTTPLMEQPSMTTKLDSGALMIKKRLNEINTELKNIQQRAAKRDIKRGDLVEIESDFNKATKKNNDLKDEIAREQYQLTSDEEALSEEVDEKSAAFKKTIAKLKDFLRMPQGSELLPETRPSGAITISGQQDMTTEDRQKILQGIKTFAPELYNLIIQVDPTGEKHIVKDYYNRTLVSVRPSWETGLPIIGIGEKALERPQKEMLFVIGHELSHYVLGHQVEEYHYDYAPGDLLAKARVRIRENEADRMSIIEFGNSVDSGIAAAQGWIKMKNEYTLESPHRETFKEDHPLSVDRMKHMESLRSEVELNKARNRQRIPIDWNKLVQEYKNATKPQPVDPALVQKYVNKTYTQADLNRYIDNVTLKYKNMGGIQYFAKEGKDERGKPLTPDNIADFFSDYLLYELDRSIQALYFTDVKSENNLAADVLHTYYNPKLIALRYPNNQAVQALVKGVLEELLNKKIAGKSIATIIQKFEQ